MLYRQRGGTVEVLLGHPGGPYYRNRDDGIWSIPKGLLDDDESAQDAAAREFAEETGLSAELIPDPASWVDLGEVRYKSGKRLCAWAFEGECDPDLLVSNTFEIEWPPRSARRQSFPEIDRFVLLDVVAAAGKIHPAQAPLLERLVEHLLGAQAIAETQS